MESQAERPSLHPAMFSRLVEINEKSFNLNDYAEGLQQFEELLEEYGKESSSKTVDKNYFADTEELLTSAITIKPEEMVTPETVLDIMN